jgi:hypothetical protein
MELPSKEAQGMDPQGMDPQGMDPQGTDNRQVTAALDMEVLSTEALQSEGRQPQGLLLPQTRSHPAVQTRRAVTHKVPTLRMQSHLLRTTTPKHTLPLLLLTSPTILGHAMQWLRRRL